MITGKEMMHGVNYTGQDVSGWLASEKLNGCRAFWDGIQMWTRGGHIISLPARISSRLPDFPLDGEMYAGSNNFEAARMAVQYGSFVPDVHFVAFDLPANSAEFAERYEALTRLLPLVGAVCYAPHFTISGIAAAAVMLSELQAMGGEGLMLRDPVNLYQPGRTNQVLKLKQWEAA